MIAISIGTAGESILEFAAVNEDNKMFHCFGAGLNELGWCFAHWLGYDNYDIVAVDFHSSIKLFLLKVPDFPVWNRRVLDLESLYFDGVNVPRLKDIAPSVFFAGTRVRAQAIMEAFLKKKKELLS